MRHVLVVPQEKLELVHAERERDLRFGLARAEVQVVKVAGNRLVERRQRRIDHQVVMTGIGLLKPSGRHAHIDETEADDGRPRHIGMVRRKDEIDLGIRRRGVSHNGSLAAMLMRLAGQCRQRVLRGGSFAGKANLIRSAARFRYDQDVRYYANGFRVARDLR